ncbi:hypothetical protein R1flu_001142 [Riccia fluitans]|uniref:PIN-like protein n=1 Tax=Riccia fluitans TaxID=41844 RepID=A0ABD1Y2H0_9MARC
MAIRINVNRTLDHVPGAEVYVDILSYSRKQPNKCHVRELQWPSSKKRQWPSNYLILLGVSSIGGDSFSSKSGTSATTITRTMAAMTGQDFWELLQYILPFFVILFPAYGMAKMKILAPVHAPGLNRWTSLVGIPIYVGHMVAFNDPYQTNLRLVGADALQKLVVLIVAVVWWRFAKSASIDGVITFFMLATLSNMVLVGPALFRPLHGTQSDVSIATIILLQCVLWYNLCIALFETRNVLKEMRGEDLEALHLKSEAAAPEDLDHNSNLPGLPFWTSRDGPETSDKGKHAPSLTRSVSAPTRVSLATSRIAPVKFLNERSEEDSSSSSSKGSLDDYKSKELQMTDVQITFVVPGIVTKDLGQDQSTETSLSPAGLEADDSHPALNGQAVAKILYKVFHRVKYAPLLYTSTIGFVYSLFAFRYGWEMPYTIRQSIELIAKGAIAISVVTMALTWHASGKVVAACGYKRMFYGWIIRFLVGPVIMVLASFAFGLKGIAFEFSVLQSSLPVGLVSFVLAKEYNLDVEVFSTAVITQLVIFLPIVVIYYFILQIAE